MHDDDIRIDKWLWAARFFKSRGLAQDAIESARVLVGGERVKTSRVVRVGDQIRIKVGEVERTVVVRELSAQRGSAPIAQRLYEETDESVRRRVEEQARRALYADPANAIEHGRPTKRDRRRLDRMAD